MKMIDKDLLDMEKCRADLLFNFKGNWPFHLLLTGVLAFFAALLQFVGTLAALDFSEEWLVNLLPLLWLLPAGYLTVYGVRFCRKQSWIKKAKLTVAEDTFCGAEDIMRLPKTRYRALHDPILDHVEIHFAEHGMYKTTMTHGTWSKKGNRMNCSSLTDGSDAGDKYYLILDERVKEGQAPKILLAYPQKYFIWQD